MGKYEENQLIILYIYIKISIVYLKYHHHKHYYSFDVIYSTLTRDVMYLRLMLVSFGSKSSSFDKINGGCSLKRDRHKK